MMNKLDLSLDGILDSRWTLKGIGNGRLKLEYSSLKGIPSQKETQMAIRNVLSAKKISSIYISGPNGDIEVTSAQLEDGNLLLGNVKSQGPRKDDVLSRPFGAEDDLLKKEERGVF